MSCSRSRSCPSGEATRLAEQGIFDPGPQAALRNDLDPAAHEFLEIPMGEGSARIGSPESRRASPQVVWGPSSGYSDLVCNNHPPQAGSSRREQ
jgi:hypothetical protein